VSRVVVVGGGIGGLASAALLGRAGHRVTLLEANDWLGGKSRRIELDGRRMDTGPSLVTFPGVWDELLRRWDGAGGDGARVASGDWKHGTTPASKGEAVEVAGMELERLPEVGRYHFRGESVSLPVEEGHPWRGAWERFVGIHGGLGPEVTRLLTADPVDRRTLPALGRLLRAYGAKLTTRSYLDGLSWLPWGLKEVIAIHTLNAGVAPTRTPALYASMPAIMASDGVFAPKGGVYEVVLALEKLALRAGVEVRTGEPVRAIEAGRVATAEAEYRADAVVSALDASRLEALLDPGKKRPARRLSCSGVAVYAALREELPAGVPAHSVVLPSEPAALYASLEAGEEPVETMAFVNLYRAGEVYPNNGGTLAVLLTAPANGREYGLEDPFVEREIARVSRAVGLPGSATDYMGDHEVLHPRYFGAWGSAGGALYGEARPFWRSGPLHRPRYNDRKYPWLWRVGASVHPGGGIPAVLGGAMISAGRLLRSLVK
jgi:phytoene desaturase